MDVASGNRDPGGGTQGTFDGLFFKSGYFNDASLLRPENIIDIHPNLTLKLAPKRYPSMVGPMSSGATRETTESTRHQGLWNSPPFAQAHRMWGRRWT